MPHAPRLIQNAVAGRERPVLPMAWYAIHLTNRRYGAGHAFAQLVAGLVILGLVALINPGDIDNWIDNMPGPDPARVLAFGGAFLVANFVAIIFFDAARGPRWWTAPLAASFAASFVFSAVYYPAAFAGVVCWTRYALVHFSLFFGEIVLLLMPYWLLRPRDAALVAQRVLKRLLSSGHVARRLVRARPARASSANSVISCSVMAPPSCSASTMVTALR